MSQDFYRQAYLEKQILQEPYTYYENHTSTAEATQGLREPYNNNGSHASTTGPNQVVLTPRRQILREPYKYYGSYTSTMEAERVPQNLQGQFESRARRSWTSSLGIEGGLL